MNINLACVLNQLSYGLMSVNVLKALSTTNSISLFPISQTIDTDEADHNLIRSCLENAKRFDVKAPSLRIWHQFGLQPHVGKGLHAGFPIFELNRFNDLELHHLRSQDRLFVASNWAREVLVQSGLPAANVFVAPFGVDTDIFRPECERAVGWDKEQSTVFINVGKWELRKGHNILAAAFNMAFEPSDNVKLTLACSNPFCNPQETAEWVKLFKNSKMGDKVNIVENRLKNQQEVAALMADADCGVFPALAEGWNMGASELLAMGKSLIITDYSAHTEFCNSNNSMLISVGLLETAFDGKFFYGAGEWASFGTQQMEQLVTHLRSVHKAKQAGELKPNESGIETFKTRFTWTKCAEAIVNGLQN